MKFYEITYKTPDNKTHTAVVEEHKGWENQYHQSVLNRIESLVYGGAVITGMIEHK